MAGIVRTVLGDVEPAALGVTLTHEHLWIMFADLAVHWQVANCDRPADPPTRGAAYGAVSRV